MSHIILLLDIDYTNTQGTWLHKMADPPPCSHYDVVIASTNKISIGCFCQGF